MACVALSSLMRTIELDLLNPRRRAIVEDEEQVKYLYQSLGFLKEFLDKKSKDNIAAKNLEAKIKDLAFQIEDRIEKKLETIYGGETYSEAEQQKAQRRLPEDLKQAIRDTEDLMVEIRDSPVQDFPSADQEDPPSKHAAGSDSDVMEGRGQKFEEIMDQLIRSNRSSGREVISILGMGGIGKTTLARRLYEDPLVLSHFDVLGWTVVSQKHDVRKMLLDLLHHPKGKDNELAANIEELTDGELAGTLKKCLSGKRYLIVLDDIWSISCWEGIQLCFPDENCGSRILLTTRHKEVADSADSSGNRLHTLGFLNSEESWNLFCKQFPAIQSLPFEFESIGRDIVDKCQGLPLAIVVVAGVVSKLNQTVEEWQVFEKQTNSLVVTTDLTEQCSRILSLSYNYLPLHLKACFLFLSTVSEDEAIIVKRLIRLWIAEGFVELINRENLEEVAHGYLQDLVDRSLILIQKRRSNGKIKTCTMHDTVHDFCVREAIKEKLLNDEGNKQHPTHQEGYCRWLHFLPKTINNDDDSHGFDNVYVPRSILHLHTSYASSQVIEPDDLRWGSLLRVLELSPPLISSSSLNHISLLRYLDICVGDSSLPLLSRSQNLQTLIVSHKPKASSYDDDERSSCHLPSEIIWASQELSHVECSYSVSLDPPNEVKENLHTLYWLSPHHCTQEMFSRIPNVRKLGIYISITSQPETDDDGDEGSLNNNNILDNLHHLIQLETLKITAIDEGRFDPNSSTTSFKVQQAFPQNIICLRNPEAFPENLKELTLDGTRLRWEQMSIIGYMPSLEVLKLKNDAACGETWEPSNGGFPRLKFLLIDLCNNFKYWDATAEHYPVLEHLVVRKCLSLEEIPSSFEDIITLRLIEMNICGSSLVDSAYQIQKAQQDFGNYGLAVRNTTPFSELLSTVASSVASSMLSSVASSVLSSAAEACQIM